MLLENIMERNKKIENAIAYHSQCAQDFYVIVKAMEDCESKWHVQSLMYTMFYASLFSKRKFEIDLLFHQIKNNHLTFSKDPKKLYFAHVMIKKLLDKMAHKSGIYTVPALKENSKAIEKAITHDLDILREIIVNTDNQDIEYLHKVAKYLEICNRCMNEIICVLK